MIGLVECDKAGALQIAERIRMNIAQEPFVQAHHATAVTVSIGVAMLSSEIDRIETLITRADEAMYEAKRRGAESRGVVRRSVRAEGPAGVNRAPTSMVRPPCGQSSPDRFPQLASPEFSLVRALFRDGSLSSSIKSAPSRFRRGVF